MTILVNTVAFVLSVLFFALSFRFPHLASDPGGLGLLPRIAAVVTATGCILYFLNAVFVQRVTIRCCFDSARKGVAEALARPKIIIAFVLIILMPLGIEWLGFIAGTFVFVACLMMISNIGLVRTTVTSLAISAAIYVGYAYVLGAVLPPGKLFG